MTENEMLCRVSEAAHEAGKWKGYFTVLAWYAETLARNVQECYEQKEFDDQLLIEGANTVSDIIEKVRKHGKDESPVA